MTEVECRRLILAMTTTLPREWSFLTKEQQAATEAAYVRMLSDLPYDAARAAVERLLATSETMPKVATIRAATLDALHGHVIAGGSAWGSVRALRTYRDRDDLEGVDPIALHICELYGWIETRTLWRNGADVAQWHVVTGDNETADRARFIELYDRLAREQRSGLNTSQLPAAREFRALQRTNQAALPAAPDGDTSGAMNARSGQNGPARGDFNRFLSERTEDK